MKKLFLICFSFFFFNGVLAQYRTVKAAAEKEFDNKNYSQAAYYYNRLATGSYKKQQKITFSSGGQIGKQTIADEHPYICYQLAESYRLYRDYDKAEKWYDTVLIYKDETDFPLAKLWYGTCLRANGHFDNAIAQLKQFKAGYKGDQEYLKVADREIATCLFAEQQYKESSAVEIKKMDIPWNTDGGNYALTKSGTNYWFTSTRTGTGNSRNVNHIYQVANSSPPSLVNLSGAESMKDVHYSTPSFDPVHKRLFIAGWYKVNDEVVSAIYYANWNDNNPSPLQKLNDFVNVDGSMAIQPFVTPDGKRLFFASDRPGGLGGFDIWVSNLDAEGHPVDATNLGKTINTAEDEQAPFYEPQTGRLVFSSKGFTGLGGYDLFESYNSNGQWTAPKNLGYPINSSKDDLYYFADPNDSHHFFISSDRESECCLALFSGRYKSAIVTGLVSDCHAAKLLADVKVSLVDSASGTAIAQTKTDANGRYSLELPSRKVYKLIFEKQGHFTKSATCPLLPNADNQVIQDICLEAYILNKPIVIQNILYDFNKASLRPESLKALDGVVTIMRDNPGIEIELSSHTDSIGSDAYNLKLSQQRAQSCVDYIISKGIDKERIIAKGYGKTVPIAPNSLPNGKDNPAGRQLNRRTEFKVIGQKQ